MKKLLNIIVLSVLIVSCGGGGGLEGAVTGTAWAVLLTRCESVLVRLVCGGWLGGCLSVGGV